MDIIGLAQYLLVKKEVGLRDFGLYFGININVWDVIGPNDTLSRVSTDLIVMDLFRSRFPGGFYLQVK